MTTKNRDYWERTSGDYQATHGGLLERAPLAWGVWRIPEAHLRVLGELAGRRVLELGCGAAQWTIALAALGARAVGFDLSARQLAHARQASRSVRLVRGSAGALPFGPGSFDVVFCDHGAMSFAPPEQTLPEVSRVLAPGGLLAFCMATPLLDLCWSESVNAVTPQLQSAYFGMTSFDAGDMVTYQKAYGEWIRLFRRHGLTVEDLVELQPPEEAATTFTDFVPLEWARRWPAEHIWKLRRRP